LIWARATRSQRCCRVLLAFLLLWLLLLRVPGIFLSATADLVACLSDRGDGGGRLGTVCLVRC